MTDVDRATPAEPDGATLDAGVARLRLLAIVAPALFVAALLTVTLVFLEGLPLPVLVAIVVLAATAAAALFSGIVFDVVERGEARLRQQNERLTAVRAAAMSIAGEYQLDALLQRFVDVSRELTNARYGAMSVLRADGSIDQFITSGISAEERARMGDPPTGHGLLGHIMREGALRIDDISKDPRSGGFPPRHPRMTSLLGVPVEAQGRTLGNLYLTDKIGSPGFSEADEEMVRTFAAQAALAIETSRLQDELRLLAVLRERERIGMDLHDGIIQSIYAVGLQLEAQLAGLRADPEARASIESAIDKLELIIRDVRSYIFELRPAKMSFDLSESIERMVREFAATVQAEVRAEVSPGLPPMSEDQRSALFHIAKEALTNARKHAHASVIRLALRPELNWVELAIEDNGKGFDATARVQDDHHGLENMTARAMAAGGAISIDTGPGAGTKVTVRMPVGAQERALR